MSEVYYLSDIGAEATDLVQRYMTKFFPDAKAEMLAPKGLINTCKRKLPDASWSAIYLSANSFAVSKLSTQPI